MSSALRKNKCQIHENSVIVFFTDIKTNAELFPSGHGVGFSR